MLFIISKIFNFLTSPINWIIILIIIGFIWKRRKFAIHLLSIIVFLIFTNNQSYTAAVNHWSAKYNNRLEAKQKFEIAIVAGGAVAYSENWNQLNYNDRADRITEAIRLYRKGTIKYIYISGEAAFNEKRGVSYAPQFLSYMKEMGVNPNDIILEKQARTTAENIANLKAILRPNQNQEILLISSGWHLKRLLKGFQGSGLKLVPYAVDVPSLHPAQEWQDYLPSWKAAQKWQTLIHEMVGILII